MSFGVGDGNFAVEQGRAARQACERFDQRREFLRPVQCVTGANDDALAGDRSDRAITVELDFVQPLIAGGRRLDEGGELRFYEGGKLERGEP